MLSEIKADERIKHIPVVVLTSSEADMDIIKSYALHANCYITKPVDLERFMAVIKTMEDFWLTTVKLPFGELDSSPFKVVLSFGSLRKNFSRRDMRCIFTAFTLWSWFFRTSGMFTKG